MNELDQIFDLVPADPPEKESVPVSPVISEEHKSEDLDYEYVRKNYYEIIKQGQEAIEGALRVAKASDNPRAFEVVGGLLKNLADVNRQLIQVADDTQKVKVTRKNANEFDEVDSEAQQITNNTAVFFGSPSDLNRLMSKDEEDADNNT